MKPVLLSLLCWILSPLLLSSDSWVIDWLNAQEISVNPGRFSGLCAPMCEGCELQPQQRLKHQRTVRPRASDPRIDCCEHRLGCWKHLGHGIQLGGCHWSFGQHRSNLTRQACTHASDATWVQVSHHRLDQTQDQDQIRSATTRIDDTIRFVAHSLCGRDSPWGMISNGGCTKVFC